MGFLALEKIIEMVCEELLLYSVKCSACRCIYLLIPHNFNCVWLKHFGKSYPSNHQFFCIDSQISFSSSLSLSSLVFSGIPQIVTAGNWVTYCAFETLNWVARGSSKYFKIHSTLCHATMPMQENNTTLENTSKRNFEDLQFANSILKENICFWN